LARLLKPDEALAIAQRPIPPEDRKAIRSLYERSCFISASKIGEFSRDFRNPKERAAEMYKLLSPDLRDKIPLSDVEAVFGEHTSAESELFGDFPIKLKKWVLFCLPEHADRLADVAFAAFRLDDLKAVTVRLPSGRDAIIVNTSLLLYLWPLTSLFIDIYNAGLRNDDKLGFKSSLKTKTLLRLAKAYATNDVPKLPEILKDAAPLRTDIMTIQSYIPLIVALHEAGHLLLGHLTLMPSQLLNTAQPQPASVAHDLEYKADSFAVGRILHLDKQVSMDHSFNVLTACSVWFGFTDLVKYFRGPSTGSHPSSTNRWTNVRSAFVESMGTELYVKRFEHIMQGLNMEREWWELNA